MSLRLEHQVLASPQPCPLHPPRLGLMGQRAREGGNGPGFGRRGWDRTAESHVHRHKPPAVTGLQESLAEPQGAAPSRTARASTVQRAGGGWAPLAPGARRL